MSKNTTPVTIEDDMTEETQKPTIISRLKLTRKSVVILAAVTVSVCVATYKIAKNGDDENTES